MKRFTKKQAISLILAALLGAFWLIAIRFVLLEKQEVHYHANFAVFVDGERLPFDRFTFYEEIESCGGPDVNNPKIRAHMHDQVNHVVHVHDNGASWGHFFANLSFTNGDSVFRTDSATYVEDDDTQIRFLLNNNEVDTTANRAIGDEDVLLVSIGNPTDEDLRNQYDQISQDAAIYNEKDDPSSCSGGKPFTTSERLRTALKFWD
jgi:hypothetical protein